MHVYDLLMLAILVLLAWGGYRRGLVRGVAGLAAFLVGLVLAARCAAPAGGRLATAFPGLSPATARVLAFLAVALLAGIAVELAARVLAGALRRVPVVGALDRLGGLLAGAALGALVVWLLTVSLLLLPPALLPFASAVRSSRAAQLVRAAPRAWGQDLRTHLSGPGGASAPPAAAARVAAARVAAASVLTACRAGRVT
jgi:uncharacterized membrane protein required for colicin V production